MFTNFNNIFKSSKRDKTRLPKEILEVLNRKIPEELEYEEIENYVYNLDLKNGYMQDLGEHEEEYVPKWEL